MMSRKRRVKYHVRRRLFLNRDPNFPAYIIGIVQDTRDIPGDDPDESWKWGDIELKLGDCYRRVSLSFDMETREERANSLFKIRRLAEIVNAMREAIEVEVTSIDARPEKQNKKEE